MTDSYFDQIIFELLRRLSSKYQLKMKKITFAFLSYVIGFLSFSQSQLNTIQSFDVGLYAPPSPEAAAMSQYGNVGVSMFTGTPDISIPIYTFKGKDNSLPVSLSYNASGIKVTQIASEVGLGWNLNIGGAITRRVIGRADDYTDLSINDYDIFYSLATDYTSPGDQSTVKAGFEFVKSFYPSGVKAVGQYEWYFRYMEKAESGDYETQPDVYDFSINGLSGTIFIDYETDTAYCVEHPDLLILPTMTTGNNRVISGWTLLDSKGIMYRFEEVESTYIYEHNDFDSRSEYNSAWKISYIESERDRIDFSYDPPVEWTQEQYFGSTASFNDYSESYKDLYVQGAIPTYKITQSRLSEINLGDARLVLGYDLSERSDLAGKHSLNKISIRDGGLLLKDFRFNYSYFEAQSPSSEFDYRLKLDNVGVFGFKNNAESGSPQYYTFDYISGNIPSRSSFAQDYWGYYNGADQNTSLIPSNLLFDQGNVSFSGADREPDYDYGKIATLNSITYPTGGSTEFYYQAHYQNSYPKKTSQLVTAFHKNIVGGIDSADPFNFEFCDGGESAASKGYREHFTVKSGGSYALKFHTLGLGNLNPGNFQFIAIYKSGDIGSCSMVDGQEICAVTNTITREPCDFLASPPVDRVYYSYGNRGGTQYFSDEIQLEANSRYTVLVLNSDPGITLDLTISGIETTTENISEVGGLRVFKIQDIDSDEIQSTRYIHYDNLSDVSTISTNLFDVVNGAGMLHERPLFETGYNIYDYGEGGPQNIGYLSRGSNNTLKSGYQVTYDVVSEINYDYGNDSFSQGYRVSYFNQQPEQYYHGFAKNSVLNGRVDKVSTFNNSGNLVTDEVSNQSQHTYGDGIVGFANRTPLSIDKTREIYVVSTHDNPSEEFLLERDKETIVVLGSPFVNNCAFDGDLLLVRTCADLGNDELTNSEQDIEKDIIENAYGIRPSYAFDYQLCRHGFTVAGYYDIIYCNGNSNPNELNSYLIPKLWGRLDQSTSTQYFGSDEIETVNNYSYDALDHYQVVESTSTSSNGDVLTTKLYYAHELNDATLISDNNISTVLKQETYKTDDPVISSDMPLSTTRLFYTSSGTKYLPSRQEVTYENGTPQTKITFHRYDSYGNPNEITGSDGIRRVLLWAYDAKLLVAQIDNTTYSAVSSILSANGISDINSSSETQRATAFEAVKNGIPMARITSYTHIPGIGVKTITDPNGLTTTYEYDSFGRLIQVVDHNNNVLQKNDYNYGN